MAIGCGLFYVVVMAKWPIAGAVKTRLNPVFTPEQAADVHAAMMQCVLDRLSAVFGSTDAVLVIALDRADLEVAAQHWPNVMPGVCPAGWRMIEQGAGDLGDRMNCVVQSLITENDATENTGFIFFGIDSPDFPFETVAHLPHQLKRNTVAVGPVADGGYWTLAAQPWRPELAADIDWGTSKVYDQTCSAIASAGLIQIELPQWFDVDRPNDVEDLRRRLVGTDEPALRTLAHQLELIWEDAHR